MKSYKLENINQKMFDKCGLLMTDLVGVHGMDPHLPAHLPLHLPSARVAAQQYCASAHNHTNFFGSHSYFCMQNMKTPLPSAECLLDNNSCLSVGVVIGFLCCISCYCVRGHQKWAACIATVPEKDAIIEGTMIIL